MALKSSQPRRNASPKSETLILRTTKAVETPNSCSLGLANTVAMAPVSLPVIAGNGAPSNARIRLVRENRDRARQIRFNEKELCRTTPVATGTISLSRRKQDSAHGWVICAPAHLVCCVAPPDDRCRRMLMALRIGLARPGRDIASDRAIDGRPG